MRAVSNDMTKRLNPLLMADKVVYGQKRKGAEKTSAPDLLQNTSESCY